MDLVKVKNTGSEPLILRHDGLGDVTIAPGADRIVQIQIANVAFGHPGVRNEGNRKHRDDEYGRLRVQWGFYAGLMTEDEWDEMRPRFECYNLDDERIHFILDDPEGTKNSAGLVGQDPGSAGSVQDQITSLQAQIAQLTRALSNENAASTPSVAAAQTTANIDGETDDDDGYPIPTGSGWYELSDGTKIQGEERATSAQAALDALGTPATIDGPDDADETQESRNEQRDEIPKPADDEPDTAEDSPRTTRVGSVSAGW